MSDDIQPRWLTRKGVKKYSGLALSTIDLHIKSGRFKSHMLDGRRLVDRLSIDAAVEGPSCPSPADEPISEARVVDLRECLERAESVIARLHSLADMLEGKVADLDRKSMTLAGAAKYSGLSQKTITRAIAAGQVKRNPPGGRILVIRASLDAWIDGGKTTAPTS